MDPWWLNIIREHMSLYPLCEVLDIYKVLFQANMGPAHNFHSHNDDYFINEQWNIAVANTKHAIEPISPDGEIVRAHFGALREQNIQLSSVLRAFELTAEHFVPNQELLQTLWQDLGEAIREGELFLSPGQYRDLSAKIRANGFVAMHHSEAFRSAYDPAYLVVFARYIKPAILSAQST